MRTRKQAIVALAGLAAAIVLSLWALRACGERADGGPESAGTDVRSGAADASGDSGPLPVVGTTTPSSRGRAVRPADAAAAPDDAAVPGDGSAVPSRDARVTFIVLRSEDRTPIEGARVLVGDEAGHREFATDHIGQVEVRLVAGWVDYGVVADGRARRQCHQSFEDGEASEVLLEPGAQAVGRVSDAATGLPITGATVDVRAGGFDGWDEFHPLGDWEVGRATTDAEGRFRVEGLARDLVFTLRASAPGYASEERPVTPETTGPCVADVALGRARTLRLQILDEAGAPHPSAYVFVRTPGAGSASPFGNGTISGSADREGRFVAAGLRRDTLYDVTVHSWYMHESGDAVVTHDAVQECLPPGDTDAERIVRFQTPARLRVLAAEADGAPRQRIRAAFRRIEAHGGTEDPETDDSGRTSYLEADGLTGVDLRPGSYEITLRDSGTSPQNTQSVVLAPGEDRLVEFRLPPGVLEGRVVDPEGRPVPRGILFLHGLTHVGGYRDGAVEHGTFRLTGLEPGRWRLFVSGDWEEDRGFVTADVDVPSEPREWRLVRDPTARIRLPGTAVGRPIRVEVDGPPMPHRDPVDGWAIAMWEHDGDVKEDGTFAFRVQSTGPLRFRIRVEGFLPVAVVTPAPSGEDFDVVAPALVRGIDVVGRVVDAAGTPVKSSVEVVAPAGFGDVQWGTAEDGGFRIPGLPPGPVLLAVRPQRHRAERSVRVKAREGMDPVEIVVSRGGTLDVLCTDARGVPLPGRLVEADAADSAVDEGPLGTTRLTDARGRARFRVHPGTWRVWSGGDFDVVELAEGATAPVRLVLR